MRALRLAIPLYLILGVVYAAAQSDFDGDYWKTKSSDAKLLYVVGFVDGRNLGINEAATALQTDFGDSRLKSLNTRITVGQLVDGLDDFYKDWRNTKIRIREALEYVTKEAQGKDGTKLLLFLRQQAAAAPENK